MNGVAEEWNDFKSVVERASCCGMGILPVINIFGRAGCPSHSYSSEDSAIPKILCT
ncbi:MAG: hypothetical protein F6K65_26880 [Moorea sp. SIO3C2]|nr:hypothetical protein [Moorena sp. SIO3C2]